MNIYRKEETWKPTATGILCIVAGAVQTVLGLVLAIGGGLAGELVGVAWLPYVGIALIALGVAAVIGGIYALLRRIWVLALAGSIITMLVGVPITGILAVLFVSLGKDEFD